MGGRHSVSSQSGLPDQAADFPHSLGGRMRHGHYHFVEPPGPTFRQAFRHANNWNFVNAPVPLLNIVVKKGHDSSAEVLSDRQFASDLAARVSRAHDSHARRRAFVRSFPRRRTLTPEPD